MQVHELTFEVDAPPDVVWSIVTEPRHVARWFSDEAEIDLRPGGAMLLTWHRHGTFQARVETVDPPRTFAFRWLRRTVSLRHCAPIPKSFAKSTSSQQ